MRSHRFFSAPAERARLVWLFAALALAALLASLEGWAITDHLYWRYVWSDTAMHFLGGAMAGALAAGLLLRFRPISYALTVVAISFGWELFELWIGTPRGANFAFDSSLDLLMDALGAIAVYGIARKTLWRSALKP